MPPAFVYLILFTMRVAVPSSQPSVALGSVFIHRISALIEHVPTPTAFVDRASEKIASSAKTHAHPE